MMRREKHFSPKRIDRNSTSALIGRVDILISGRIVQLTCRGFGKNVIVSQFPVVDLGTDNLDRINGGGRRDVLDEEFRQSLWGYLVDGSEHYPVAMGVS